MLRSALLASLGFARLPRGPVTAVLTAAILFTTPGCGAPQEPTATTVTLWRHDGTDAENRTFATQVRAFNNAGHHIRIEVRSIPEGDYNDVLLAAAAAGGLPDIVEVDGPLVASYVYQRQLAPLDGLLDAADLAGQLPSLKAQGTVGGHPYAVGVFDSGLGLFADRRQLRAAGITDWPRTPTQAWTASEFTRVLRRLAAHDPDGRVLDVKENYGVGEWLTYGFAPLVSSAGGSLVDPDTLTPAGHLDGPATVRALTQLAAWARFVDPDADDAAFVQRRVALSWVGHWVYRDYARALGPDLLVLPLPDLGSGSKTGQGSWAWGISAHSAHSEQAADFLHFLLSEPEVLRMTAANGAVPGTQDALGASAAYQPGGPLRLFAEQLLASCGSRAPTPDCVAVPRPTTPGYPMLSAQFAEAVAASLAGRDPTPALRAGTRRAQSDFEANGGYR